MLNTTMRSCRTLTYTKLMHFKRSAQTAYHTRHIQCLCGNIYIDNRPNRIICYSNARVHSTQNEQRRQKAVIETSTPRISIDKLNVLKDGKERHSLLKKIEPYIQLSRWDRPIGVYLLYWPCSWSIALASLPGDVPISTTLQTAGLFLVGAGLMRGAGCTINDLWDKDIDAQVERTKDRPLVSGALTKTEAVSFLAAQLSLALGILLQLNCYSVVLGASSMLLVVTYPLAKRFTNYPQLFLGATFNWGALLGYTAIRGDMDPAVCLPLYIGSLAWTLVYDTIYAHQDKLDDARIGMKSTALTFGHHTKPALSAALGVTAACLAGVGVSCQLSTPYYLVLGAAVTHSASQIYKLDVDNPKDCANKFKANSKFGLFILLGILAGGYHQYLENKSKHVGQENRDLAKSCIFG